MRESSLLLRLFTLLLSLALTVFAVPEPEHGAIAKREASRGPISIHQFDLSVAYDEYGALRQSLHIGFSQPDGRRGRCSTEFPAAKTGALEMDCRRARGYFCRTIQMKPLKASSSGALTLDFFRGNPERDITLDNVFEHPRLDCSSSEPPFYCSLKRDQSLIA